ncbi:hypothetical protein CC86DRAFT_370647 [Ophiobolus disseminans]|uniref:Uncharacterized protein n=1 Tax=Ophiobolus disseminans TaxID=1469910 RepID=A0A6A6ZY03_9PLEO|nr:hypothetical protein CC86DRAFT_370647 [Ophiobolus disseminans]
MTAPSATLRLPRELRDLIFKFYFSAQDGYTFNDRAGRLRTSSKSLAELDLRLTC